MGKADALVLKQAGHTVLIDTGEKDDGDKIVRFLKNQGIHSVDLLVITHFDKDHVGGAAKVLEHMEVNAVFMPDYEGTRPEYDSFLEALAGRDGVQRLTGTMEQTIGAVSYTHLVLSLALDSLESATYFRPYILAVITEEKATSAENGV